MPFIFSGIRITTRIWFTQAAEFVLVLILFLELESLEAVFVGAISRLEIIIFFKLLSLQKN